MATKITQEEIKKLNELYYECKSYAEVARKTGRAASTVKKYIDVNWKPEELQEKKEYKFDKAFFPKRGIAWNENDDLSRLCKLTEAEKEFLKKEFK